MIICFAVRFEIAGSNDETLQSAIKVLIENKQTNWQNKPWTVNLRDAKNADNIIAVMFLFLSFKLCLETKLGESANTKLMLMRI